MMHGHPEVGSMGVAGLQDCYAKQPAGLTRLSGEFVYSCKLCQKYPFSNNFTVNFKHRCFRAFEISSRKKAWVSDS